MSGCAQALVGSLSPLHAFVLLPHPDTCVHGASALVTRAERHEQLDHFRAAELV